LKTARRHWSGRWRWWIIFELDAKLAHAIAAEVGQVVSTWRGAAAGLGLSPSEIDRMASAFEHEDLRRAIKPRSRVGKADA
jgi:hypothetical protein